MNRINLKKFKQSHEERTGVGMKPEETFQCEAVILCEKNRLLNSHNSSDKMLLTVFSKGVEFFTNSVSKKVNIKNDKIKLAIIRILCRLIIFIILVLLLSFLKKYQSNEIILTEINFSLMFLNKKIIITFLKAGFTDYFYKVMFFILTFQN